MVSTNADLSYREKMDLYKSSRSIQTKSASGNSAKGTQGKGLHGEELRAFYEKDVKEDEKSKVEIACLLAII
ncbi:13616_t:CDS:2 [Funneliformis caledonium]|uniref:13616_t:CDS:1 n=1 Tax=Funneliformis caledonium TaxID=1117310 RepID=A0A9N9C5A2_9GLOM|nr:13616_t:CDS:2 [Funneliformis caledonium]